MLLRESFTFLDGRESSEEKRKIEPMHIDSGLYPSFVIIFVAMNSKIRERLVVQAFEDNGIYVSVDKITQKIAVHLPDCNYQQLHLRELRIIWVKDQLFH